MGKSKKDAEPRANDVGDEGSEKRNYSLIFRVDGMTASELENMHQGLSKLKRLQVSDEGRAVLLTGKSSELPGKIKALLDELQNDRKAIQSSAAAKED